MGKFTVEAACCIIVKITFLVSVTLLPTLVLAEEEPNCHQPNPVADPDIKALKGGDDKRQIVAATALLNRGPELLPTVMLELKAFRGPTTNWSNEDQAYFLSITDVMRSTVSNNPKAVRVFRICRDDSIIKPLMWAARSPNQSMRVNATVILGNVLDNTTVCFALHHLKDKTIGVNGRANLLGAAVAMASYAYKDNAESILQTLELLKRNIANESGELGRTKELMVELESRTKDSSNRTQQLPVELRRYCAGYNYQAELD